MGIYGKKVIHEVYFGNTPEIKDLQDTLSKLRKDTIDNDKLFSNVGNTSPYLFEFNRKCEDMFGFKTFALNIIYQDEVNAFTFGLGGALDTWGTEKNFRPTKSGMKFDKDAGYNCICFIYSGLFKDPKFTDREIMGIILHEIGHNFTSSISPTSRALSSVKKAIRVVDLIQALLIMYLLNPLGALVIMPLIAGMSSNKILGYIYKITSDLHRKYPELFKFMDWYDGAINQVNSLINTVNYWASIIKNGPDGYIRRVLYNISLKYSPIHLFYAFLGYNDEKLSDSFATMYGYGPDVSSGLMKMNYTPKSTMKLVECINEILYLPIGIMTAPCDEHPDTLVRARTQMQYLQDELQSTTTDKKMKKAIEQDIKSIQSEIEDLRKKQNNYATKYNYKEFARWYSLVMYDLFGGDIREILAKKNNNSQIDKEYRSKLKDVKLI